MKVSRFIRQENLENYHVFRGGDHDLILIPVDASHALLLAGKDLAKADRILQTVEGMLFVRGDVENILQSLGVAPVADGNGIKPSLSLKRCHCSNPTSLNPRWISTRCSPSADKKSKVKDLDAFWNDAVEKTGSIPTNPDVITFEEARKLGLNPGKRNTGRQATGPLK